MLPLPYSRRVYRFVCPLSIWLRSAAQNLQKNKVNSNTFYLLDTPTLEDVVRDIQLVCVSDGMSRTDLDQCYGLDILD
jgi:hypothetical protein